MPVQAIENVYVNIYDFIAAQKSSKAPLAQRFSSVKHLAEYSILDEKVYPLEKAKRETFHRALLQELFHPEARSGGGRDY